KNVIQALMDHLYNLIQYLDDDDYLSKNLLKEDELNNVSAAELFWIYETLAKDIEFSLNSFDPEKVTEVMLQKICLRRTFLQNNAPLLNIEKKKSEIPKSSKPVEPQKLQASSSALPEVKPVTEVKPSKDWNGFIDFLKKHNPASAANLEQGNIIEPLQFDGTGVHIKLGFDHAGQVFYEHLKQEGINKKLKDKIVEFFEVQLENVQLELILVDPKLKEDKQFKSRAEIDQQKYEAEQEVKRQKLINDPNVKLAEEIFNTKVDKVIINK
ncbi:MAG: hypothetical protein ACOCUH_02270, partial [Bacteriovoracia bacterium]